MAASVPDLEDSERLALELWTAFSEDGPGGLTLFASAHREADLAAALEGLDHDRRSRLFLALPPELAAEILEEMEPEIRDELLDESSDQRLIAILSQASADDAVYFLEHLDEERVQGLLSALDARLRGKLEEQLELPEDTAGRMMVRRIIALHPFNTVQQALGRIRSSEHQQYGAIYVVDTEGKLLGVLSLRELVYAQPRQTLASIMNTDVISTPLEEDQEAVARIMQKYHLHAIPVVDENNKLFGMVTWDDAVDALEAEVEEDILHVAGTGEDPEDNESTLGRARHRLPYLLVTTIGGFVMATIIDRLGGGLTEHAILIAFMPLIPALAGNVGIQCSTVTLRSIVIGELRPGTIRARATREISVGVLLAVVLSLISGLGAALMVSLGGGLLSLALIITVAMIMAVSIAAGFGVMVPIICQRMGIDPAIAAGPFITMLNDVFGMSIYIGTTLVLLPVFT